MDQRGIHKKSLGSKFIWKVHYWPTLENEYSLKKQVENEYSPMVNNLDTIFSE
jgi:hypothetical protein